MSIYIDFCLMAMAPSNYHLHCRIARTRKNLVFPEDTRFTPVEPRAADTNGDGAADFLIATARKNEDFVTLHEDLSPHPTGDTFNWLPAEVNGDGRTDWVYFRYTPTGPLIDTMLAGETTYTPSLKVLSPAPKAFLRSASGKLWM